MSSNRSLLIIAAAILALVVLAVAVVLLAGDRKPQQFAADSPEAALQAYLAAWDDRDIEAAYGYLSTRIKGTTSFQEYRRAAEDFATYGMPPNGPDRHVFIDDVTGGGDHVVVQLTVEERYGDGMTDVQRSTRSVQMVKDAVSREVNRWRIDEPLVWLDPMPTYEYSK